jgi:hypothetical protein
VEGGDCIPLNRSKTRFKERSQGYRRAGTKRGRQVGERGQDKSVCGCADFPTVEGSKDLGRFHCVSRYYVVSKINT